MKYSFLYNLAYSSFKEGCLENQKVLIPEVKEEDIVYEKIIITSNMEWNDVVKRIADLPSRYLKADFVYAKWNNPLPGYSKYLAIFTFRKGETSQFQFKHFE